MPSTQNTSPTLLRAVLQRCFPRGPVAYLFLLQLGVFLICSPFGLGGYSDFRQLYTAAWMILTGHAPQLYNYDLQWQFQQIVAGNPIAPLPFNHLSYEALLLAPLSLVPYRVAYLVVGVFNLLLLTYTFRRVALRVPALSPESKRVPLTIILGTLPIAIALVQGQDSILLLSLFVAAWSALVSGNEATSGALVALGLFKFQFPIPIALLFLIWRRWRFLAGFTLVGLAVAGLSVWITGTQGFLAYTRMLTSMSVGLKTVADQSHYQISPWMMPNLRGLACLLLPQRASQVVTALASVAVLVYAGARKSSFPLAVLVAMLVSYHGLIHDASILLIPLTALLATSASPQRKFLTNSALVAPAVLFPLGQLYCLMTIPLIALLPELSILDSSR
jgi:Glycosyltransferase family 87